MRKFIAFPCAESPPAAPPVKDSLSVAERVSEEEGAQRPTLLHLHPADYRLIQAAACQKGFEVVEFIELAAYLCAKQVVLGQNPGDFPENQH